MAFLKCGLNHFLENSPLSFQDEVSFCFVSFWSVPSLTMLGTQPGHNKNLMLSPCVILTIPVNHVSSHPFHPALSQTAH